MPDPYRFKKNKREFALFLNTRVFMGNRLIKPDELTLRSETYLEFLKAERYIKSEQMERFYSHFKPYVYETKDFIFLVFPARDPSDGFTKTMIDFYRHLEVVYQQKRYDTARCVLLLVLTNVKESAIPKLNLEDMVRSVDGMQEIGIPREDAYRLFNFSDEDAELMDEYYRQIES